MDLIGANNWARFNSLIQIDAQDTFFSEDIVFFKRVSGLDRYMEDNTSNTFQSTTIKCLFSYNFFRQWQVTQPTTQGSLEKDSEGAIFTIKKLRDLGLLNSEDYWDFGPEDYFVHRGVIYQPEGRTFVSESKDGSTGSGINLLFMVVLQKKEVLTGLTTGSNINTP